jgi:hypothetical protein
MTLLQLARAVVNNHDTRCKMQTDNVGAEEIKQFVKVHTTASDSAVSA